MNQLNFTLVFLTFIILNGCNNSDDPIPKGKYDEGVLIINEGNFSDADGSLGFYDRSTDLFTSKIFEKENDHPFGGLMQSALIHQNLIYLINNLGDRIEVADASTLASSGVIFEGLSLPRYMVANGSKGYVSNWGPYNSNFESPESFIAIINLETLMVDKTISVGSRPEGLFIDNGKVYVSSQSSNQISVIDLESDQIQTIPAPFGTSFFFKNDSDLWLTTLDGILVMNADRTDFDRTISIANFSGKVALNTTSNETYALTSNWAPDYSFTENEIVKINLTTGGQLPIFSDKNLYGLGFDSRSGNIYIANSNAFTGNGTIIQINSNGKELGSFPSGRGPNGFIFR